VKKTIGIIAPLLDKRQFNMDFSLRLARNGRELSLATFYDWASEGFDAAKISRGIDYSEEHPAAGFYLEGLLHQHGFDTVHTNRFDEEALETMARRDPFAVCISTTMIITADSLLDLFTSVRKAMPETFIIAGGVFLWKNHLQYQKHLEAPDLYPLEHWMLFHPDRARMDADLLILAPHGKESLLEVLKELEKGRRAKLEHIPNLAFPRGNGFYFTQRQEEEVDYNKDFTRWDLVNEMPEKVPLRTSIGCPYRCRFCDFCQLYPSMFLRSRESLTEELQLIKMGLGRNAGIIHVSDDNVFINKKRVHEVCGAIMDSGLTHWIGFMRGGEYTEEEMEAMTNSGLMLGMIGVESGDPGQLKRMNKHQQIGRVKRGIEQLDAHGISVLMTFVVGFPGETAETLQNTADFMNGLELTNLAVNYQLYPLLIFPLSGLADPEVRNQWKIEGFADKWSHYTMNSGEAPGAGYKLFRSVTALPYHYAEESQLFNRSMFSIEDRRELYQLRHQLTVKMIERAPTEEILRIIKKMTVIMELPAMNITDSILQEIILLSPPQSFGNSSPGA
jgi:anaerobic magnesium-protoporphyrin IX monomethyl ester cyclase